MQGNIRQAFEYAAKNPNSDFARDLEALARSGALDVEAKRNNIDLTPFKPKEVEQNIVEEKPKKSLLEKVTSFTGGEKIAQGLGQAIANKEISKQIEETQAQQNEIQTKLIAKIREKRELGEDTSRLENALSLLSEDMQETGEGAIKLLNQNDLTGKQVVGDALQLGTTVAGAGALKGANAGKLMGTQGVVKATTSAKTIGQGIVQGAKTGAISGGIYGASSGVSKGLKEDKNAGDIIKSGVSGATTGTITGGILGGVVGGISGGIKGTKIKKIEKEKSFVEDLVAPKATTAVKEQALKEGRVTEQGLLSASKIMPSKRDKDIAEVVKGIVSRKNTPTQNLNAIGSKVDDINSGVKAYINAKKVPFNTNQLNKQLNNGKDELNLIFASDKQAEKTYDAVVKEFVKHVKNKDTAGLFDARQSFDKIPAIKKLLDSQGLGENAKKEIVLTVRGQANKYVANLLPKGNAFRETLMKESKMLEAMQNIAEKNTGIIDMNKFQMWTKKYPVLNGVVGTVGTLLGLKAVGVGGSLIGSSD